MGRSPRGERGLKYNQPPAISGQNASLPSRGAWIEMNPPLSAKEPEMVAPLAGSVD